MKTLKFYSPSTPEELTERLLEIGITKKHIKNHLPKYFWVINKIYVHQTINKQDVECRLSKELLCKIIGVDYYIQIINNLINLGIIEKSSKYFVGIRSNGYILIDKSNIKQYEFTDSRFISKLIQQKEQEKDIRVQKDSQTLSRLFRCMSNLQHNHINQDSLTDIEKLFLDELINNPFQKVGNKGKRIYNNFCNLPTSLRSKLRLNNENLVFVDIVNSQMIFISEVIKKYIVNYNIQPTKRTNEFFRLVGNGKLYETFMKWKKSDDRTKIKKSVFKCFFSKSSKSLISKKFEKNFNQVFLIVKELKKDDYKALAHSMQQEEANLIFTALNKIDYQIDVLSIHDSLYSNESNLDLIKDALISTFNDFGITATININNQYAINTAEINPIQQALIKPIQETLPEVIQVDEIEEISLKTADSASNSDTSINYLDGYANKAFFSAVDNIIGKPITTDIIKELVRLVDFTKVDEYYLLNEYIKKIPLTFFNFNLLSIITKIDGHKLIISREKLVDFTELEKGDARHIKVFELLKKKAKEEIELYNIHIPALEVA
ncbi:hypothetical protein MM236_01050 [Belliella sp. DSM 107340]|uniref:DNA-directed RNA polymerase n=1 Tax=Belliella calami TaxID=2923436 RepID=A0ABS9UJZ1_9BACT|nr:hypothetical protein [Belliella calami]MCH7396548.1 hypothetical protein [Belliella calami]